MDVIRYGWILSNFVSMSRWLYEKWSIAPRKYTTPNATKALRNSFENLILDDEK
jgi:hypothetical protein